MPVSSRRNESYFYQNRRYKKLAEAEQVMKTGGFTRSLLKLGAVTEETLSKVIYSYVVPLEPHISAGPNTYVICGEVGSLIGYATGVPDQQLRFEWELTRGDVVAIGDEDSKETFFLRNQSDAGDREFGFTVRNTETNIFNADYFTAFATPTDWTYLSGGMPVSSFYDTAEWTGNVLTEMAKPPTGDQTNGVTNRTVVISDPQRPENYYGFEVWVKYDNEYVSLGINLGDIRDQELPSGVKSYRIRLYYNFNSVFSYEESQAFRVTSDKVIACNEVFKLDTHSPKSEVSMGAFFRSSRSTKDTGIDDSNMGFGSGMTEFSVDEIYREILTTIDTGLDTTLLGFGSGMTTVELEQVRGTRLTGGQIGGG